ncbi:FYVE, RhoGEF and PH domain-containing protein 5b [Aulostomus maculatus]
MNADCTKPSLAPKPRFVCHASLKLPSPLMSTARGPKPSIAPKPKVTLEFNGRDSVFSGYKGGCINGSLLTSDSDPEEDADNEPDKVIVEKQAPYIRSSQTDLQNVSEALEDGDVTEEEKEEEMIQKMDEDWRLTDSALTEEVDSLETVWVSDAGLTADSEDTVEMIDTDMTEDMDDDAGEALADTDGLSMGDISVNSVDEEVLDYTAEKVSDLESGNSKEKQEEEEEELNSEVLISENLQNTRGEEKDQKESAPDWGITCNKKNLRCGHELKYEQNNRVHDFIPEEQLCNTAKSHGEDGQTHEPYYITSEDIINREIIPKHSKVYGPADSPLTPARCLSLKTGVVLSRKYPLINGKDSLCCETVKNGQIETLEDYVEICNSDDYNSYGQKARQERMCVRTEEDKVDVFLNHLYCQPRFRLLADSDTLLTSSLSENQLISPSDSSRDEDDLEGHIVPFVDDTTDTDISDEHVYEDPGHSSEGENVFPFTKRPTGFYSRSMSQCMNSDVGEIGVPFGQRPCMSRFTQKGPALSSSPLLGTMHHKSYGKPHYLSLYPRSLSMEGRERDIEGSPKHRGAIYSSGRFSRCSPLSSSGLSTPTSVVDIPPPFELAYITKKPITKSSPSLLVEGDSSEKNRKKKSSIKRFLMLKFRRKTESKSVVDATPSFKSSPESNHVMPSRLLDLDRHSISSSPQLNSRSASQMSSEPASAFLFYPETKRKGSSVAFLNRSVVRVESFEDRSRVPFTPLPLTKPRSISFPNADTSDYENVPAINSDYENLQVPQRRPVRQGPFSDFFDRPTRVLSSGNDTDGYVDMSSLPGFENRTQSPEQQTESAYTEAYKVCSVAIAPQGLMAADEDQGRTSEDEDGGADSNYNRQPDGRSRAFYIAKELVDTEKLHVKALKFLQEDFREAVGAAVGDEGEPVLDEERLREILNELPDVYTLHRRILTELENRIRQWDERQSIADVFLSRKAEFLVFTTYIGHYDRNMSLLEESCRTSPAFAAIVHQFEQNPAGERVSLKYQLLEVIVRVAQYRMLLTDYLNNLSPDSQEYEDTQAAVVIVSDIADQVNDSLKHGENLLRLVNIEYSVRGQRDLLQPGRVFVKEGTLMKVSRKNRQPRHLFLMNDVLLYTYPQQDGKYRLKNTLSLSGVKVSKPVIENVQNALRIEGTDISITLSASSFIEREDWFYTLNRTVAEHNRGSTALNSSSGETRDRLCLSLGEKAPTLVPVSQVMMCMNCTSDFSLTLRRHHCHGCGRIVCRSCSKNRYPLKYMKDRMAKVCDHCYNDLKKRGEDVSTVSANSSPRPQRSNRPLSAVFQNIHPPNIWRHRKGTLTFTQVTVSDEGSISGSLHRSKKSKRNWKRLWFLLKDKVLYTFRAQEEKVASESLPLLGFTVKLSDRQEGEEEANVFQLYHKNTLYYTFRAEDNYTAQRWVNAMEEATVL